MNINHELSNKMKQLKLSGMLECVSVRTQEAAANQMSHGDYLTLLLEDELLHREQRRYERRYKKAGFKGKKLLDNFDFNFNPRINQSIIRDLATGRFIREKTPVLMVGPCGTGKTHIAQAIGHCAIQKGMDVICTTQSHLSQDLQIGRATGSYQKRFKSYAKVDLLIIDDFGLKPLRATEDEAFHELINARYEEAATLVTSNLAIEEWEQAFPNKLLGAATIDRLIHNACRLVLEGKSFRSSQKKDKKEAPEKGG